MNIINLSKFKKLNSEDDGSTIIEYAIVAPVLFLMVFGIIEFSLIMYAQSVISNATTMASRFGMTGSDYSTEATVNNAGLARVEVLKKELVNASFGLLDSNNLIIETDTFDDYAGGANGNDDNNDGVDDGCSFGQSGQGVLYKISYKWPISTPMIGALFTNNEYVLRSNVLILNEQFDGAVDDDCT